VQNKIVELLPTGQAEMEFRFPTISRIADVAWIPQKIVFEVQCATITAEEVMARNASYASIGYDVIWILHSNRYNKGCVTSAEDALKSYAHYYTDINTQGNGSIYDHYAVVEFGKRIWRFPAYSIDITKPYNHKEKQNLLKEDVPAKFLERYRHWNHGFSDDYLDAAAKMPPELSASFQKLLKETCKVDADVTLFNQVLHYIQKWIIHPYQVVFRHVLEKASR
jgi:competence protein CoiA